MTGPVRDSELVIVDGKVYHLGLRPDQLSRNIFVVGDPARAEKVGSRFDTIEHEVRNREYVTFTGTHEDMPVSVVATGIGTDNNEIALIEAFGLNEFDLDMRTKRPSSSPLTVIRLGTSGGLQEYIDVGTLAISTFALGLDNTGMFYDVPNDSAIVEGIEQEAYRILTEATPKNARFRARIHPYASQASSEVALALSTAARSLHIPHRSGITASASGFFGPQGREIPSLPITIPRLQEHLATLEVDGHRVINFEMESSLLFHLAGQMGYRVGTICPVIANRPKGTFLNDYSSAVDNCITVGLHAMHRLYRP